MGDNTTEIDLDSVIDRLLEGTSPVFARQIMILLVPYDTSIDPFVSYWWWHPLLESLARSTLR